MINKLKDYLIVVLIVAVIASFLYARFLEKDYSKQLLELKKARVKELKSEKIKVINERDSLIELGIIKYDSLLNVKPEIKYIKYEVPVYINRTLDDAIGVLSDYTYKRATNKNK